MENQKQEHVIRRFNESLKLEQVREIECNLSNVMRVSKMSQSDAAVHVAASHLIRTL